MHFAIWKNHKNFYLDKTEETLKFYPFKENKNLCVCHHIDLYLDKIKEFHKIEAQLLLTFIKPHKWVTTQTISRWISEVLDLPEINT